MQFSTVKIHELIFAATMVSDFQPAKMITEQKRTGLPLSLTSAIARIKLETIITLNLVDAEASSRISENKEHLCRFCNR